MKVSEIPFYDRPSSKLKKYGAGTLSDYELFALLLGNVKGKKVLEFSSKILKKYNLNKLEQLSFTELLKECNNDEFTALRISSFLELSKRKSRLSNGGYNKKPITSAKDVYEMFRDHIKVHKKEYLYSVLLDTKNKVIKVKRVSEGTLNSSLIHPREVFKDAIKESANSIILVHNHPSGDCSPSKQDKEITKTFKKAGNLVGINVLEHLIIGNNGYYSLKDSCHGPK